MALRVFNNKWQSLSVKYSWNIFFRRLIKSHKISRISATYFILWTGIFFTKTVPFGIVILYREHNGTTGFKQWSHWKVTVVRVFFASSGLLINKARYYFFIISLRITDPKNVLNLTLNRNRNLRIIHRSWLGLRIICYSESIAES